RGIPSPSTRQYARIVQGWVRSIGLNPATYGTHSLRRTKAALIYRKTGNLRAVQLLLGHSELESTVRYLGVEVDDAIAISEGVYLYARSGGLGPNRPLFRPLVQRRALADISRSPDDAS